MDTKIRKRDQSNFLEPLTSFRFIAALCVFAEHLHIYASVLGKYQLGYVGVSFFFVLSGFILTYAYYSKLREGQMRPIANFWVSRIAKLYPIHILTFIISLPLALQLYQSQLHLHKMTIISLSIVNLFLLQSYIPTNLVNFSFNGVSWSISDEMFFYMLFPILIVALAKLRKHITLAYLFLGWGVVWSCLVIAFFNKTAQLDQWSYYISPPLRLLDFTFGVLFGSLFLQLSQSPSAILSALKDGHYFIAEVSVVLILVAAIFVSPSLPQTLRFSVFLLPFWGALIFVFAWKRGLVSKLLSAKPLVFLGNASFSFYMIHQLVHHYILSLNVKHVTLLSLFMSLCGSCVMYIFFEEPTRIKIKNYLEKWLETERFSRLFKLPHITKTTVLPSYSPATSQADMVEVEE